MIEALQSGGRVDLDRLVAPDKRKAIEVAIARLGPDRLQPIREALGEQVSYSEIRFVLAVSESSRPDST